jgi:hypothetical protein
MWSKLGQCARPPGSLPVATDPRVKCVGGEAWVVVSRGHVRTALRVALGMASARGSAGQDGKIRRVATCEEDSSGQFPFVRVLIDIVP